MAIETRQFDGINKAEALREVLKEFPASLLQDFEFDNDTQIATFDVRGVPVLSRDPAPESEANKNLDLATVAVRELERDLQRRIKGLDEREQKLIDFRTEQIQREQAIDTKQKQLDQSIRELKRLQSGFWTRTRSFFHRIK